MTPEDRLAAYTKALEDRFETVTTYDPAIHERADRCPQYNLPYIIFHNGIAKQEGAPSPMGGTSPAPEDAVAAFAYHLQHWEIGPAKHLFWRCRPRLESELYKRGADKHRVYCRAVWV